MSVRQIRPLPSGDEDSNDFHSGFQALHQLKDIRQSRNQTREATMVITPKNYQTQQMLSPKASHFASQALIAEEDDIQDFKSSKLKFHKSLRKLIIILQFYRITKYGLNQKNQLMVSKIEKKKSLLPLYPNNRFLVIWNYFITLIQFIAVVIYPPFIGFSLNNQIDSLSIVVLFVDGIFFLDIVISFLSCKIDKNQNLIKDPKQIFKINILSWFFPDLLSILPFHLARDMNTLEEFTYVDYLNLFKLIRVIKYFTHQQQNQYLTFDVQNNDNSQTTLQTMLDLEDQLDGKIFRILMIFKSMLILINTFGCLWHLVERFDNLQYPDSNFSIYIRSLYWAMQTVTVVGYGDITAQTSMQYTLIIIWTFIGVAFYSFTIGNLAAILDEADTVEAFEQELEQLDELFNFFVFPEELQQETFDFIYYNIENNPFWNYKKIFENLPLDLRTYTTAICQKNLIENINIFKLDINFATSILPQLSINCYKQYETIYFQGSPSLEVFFLVTGEVRLCDRDGNTLLNILEGHIFGEIEILDQKNRQEHAIASVDSVVVICPIRVFTSHIKIDGDIFFEIEQLGLRRKGLLQENIARQKTQLRIRRKSALKENATTNPVSPFLQKKHQLEKNFKKAIIKESFQELQQKLLQFIFGKKSETKWKLRAIFIMAVRRIIESLRQQQKNQVQNYKRRSTRFNKMLMQNFTKACKAENFWKKQMDKQGPQQSLHIKQIMGARRMTLTPVYFLKQSKFTSQIIEEIQLKKELQKQKQAEKTKISERFMKLNSYGQKKIVEDQISSLKKELIKLKEENKKNQNYQKGLGDEIAKIQQIIKSLI